MKLHVESLERKISSISELEAKLENVPNLESQIISLTKSIEKKDKEIQSLKLSYKDTTTSKSTKKRQRVSSNYSKNSNPIITSNTNSNTTNVMSPFYEEKWNSKKKPISGVGNLQRRIDTIKNIKDKNLHFWKNSGNKSAKQKKKRQNSQETAERIVRGNESKNYSKASKSRNKIGNLISKNGRSSLQEKISSERDNPLKKSDKKKITDIYRSQSFYSSMKINKLGNHNHHPNNIKL